MKQRITKLQIDQLSEEGKEEIVRWFKSTAEIGDFIWIDGSVRQLGYDWGFAGISSGYPLLSVGQMIRFLDEYTGPMVLTRHSQWHGDGWTLNYLHSKPKELTETLFRESMDISSGHELCDALWEAVKEVLGELYGKRH